jgi:hypothetical protein
MRLQREAPLGMLFNILHTSLRNDFIALRVACVARLQIKKFRLEAKVRHMVGIRKDYLHLTARLMNGLLFG